VTHPRETLLFMALQTPWPKGHLLGFDLETTGVDRFSDVPVSYALIEMEDGITVARHSGLIDPGRDIPAGATAVHGITTEQARDEGMQLDEAIEVMVESIGLASDDGVPLVGMKLDYDLTILDVQAKRFLDRGLSDRNWAGPVLDACVIDRHVDKWRKGKRTLVHLCDHYEIVIENAHDAAADAEASMLVVLALADAFPELADMDLADLHHAQEEWHREWATSYDQWRRGQEMSPIPECDFMWPLAEVITPAA
jgi:DNA polymerase III subunit epsilon